MSDASSNTGEEQMSEPVTISCMICNLTGKEMTVYCLSGETKSIGSNNAHGFNLLQGSYITVESGVAAQGTAKVYVDGTLGPAILPQKTKVQVGLTPDMSVSLVYKQPMMLCVSLIPGPDPDGTVKCVD